MVALLELIARGEGERVELKGRGALGHPETIVKAVVALLNTKGGDVIVGVGDDGTLVRFCAGRGSASFASSS